MACNRHNCWNIATYAFAGMFALAPLPALAGGGLSNISAVLTAKWWQWAQPRDAFNTPAGDTDCRDGQGGLVWFLAGAFAADPENPIVRTCTAPIPRGKRLLIPLINAEVSANDCAEQRDSNGIITQEEIDCSSVARKRELAKAVFDGDGPDLFFRSPSLADAPVTYTCQLNASIDSEPLQELEVPIFRVQSPPFRLEDDRHAVSDGYWALLPRLSRGAHEITFGGGLCLIDSPPTDAAFLTGVTYEIVVQ